jgi:hypothetical protein
MSLRQVSTILLATSFAVRLVCAQAQSPPTAPSAAVWTDSGTGLTWAKKDNGSDLTYSQAWDYCKSLSLAGFRDWRLPEIGELRKLYDPAAVNRQYFYRGKNYDLHIKAGVQLTGCCGWSATGGNKSYEVWLLSFIYGGKSSAPTDTLEGARALCVRSFNRTPLLK